MFARKQFGERVEPLSETTLSIINYQLSIAFYDHAL